MLGSRSFLLAKKTHFKAHQASMKTLCSSNPYNAMQWVSESLRSCFFLHLQFMSGSRGNYVVHKKWKTTHFLPKKKASNSQTQVFINITNRRKCFINAKKAFKKLYIFILRRFGLFLIHLQSKNKATLGNASNSKPKGSVTQEITV